MMPIDLFDGYHDLISLVNRVRPDLALDSTGQEKITSADILRTFKGMDFHKTILIPIGDIHHGNKLGQSFLYAKSRVKDEIGCIKDGWIDGPFMIRPVKFSHQHTAFLGGQF